jgi:hypothetical protein
MAGGKSKIEFFGTSEILKKIEAAGGNVEWAVMNALAKSTEKPEQEMLDFIRAHRLSGDTEKSFIKNITQDGNKIYLELGFSIRGGGIAALFLNVGTPKIAPTWFIDNAVDHNIDAIKKAQLDALKEAFRGLM